MSVLLKWLSDLFAMIFFLFCRFGCVIRKNKRMEVRSADIYHSRAETFNSFGFWLGNVLELDVLLGFFDMLLTFTNNVRSAGSVFFFYCSSPRTEGSALGAFL